MQYRCKFECGVEGSFIIHARILGPLLWLGSVSKHHLSLQYLSLLSAFATWRRLSFVVFGFFDNPHRKIVIVRICKIQSIAQLL
ncbi:hypothetical protein BKN38_02100 [Helicobacter sp. CLO-3]|nr:hypothetical protein BA723_04480 [Helicobacter sp. CLO-3]OHU84855.1 hypothetical protein BKN38_02100 [Helicobacter sp. CLO-3]